MAFKTQPLGGLPFFFFFFFFSFEIFLQDEKYAPVNYTVKDFSPWVYSRYSTVHSGPFLHRKSQSKASISTRDPTLGRSTIARRKTILDSNYTHPPFRDDEESSATLRPLVQPTSSLPPVYRRLAPCARYCTALQRSTLPTFRPDRQILGGEIQMIKSWKTKYPCPLPSPPNPLYILENKGTGLLAGSRRDFFWFANHSISLHCQGETITAC